jgi:Ulp1 family protease
MTEKSINDAQDYLIIDYGNKRKEILNITTLLQNHTPDEVIRFLKGYLRENQKIIVNRHAIMTHLLA